MKLSKKIWSILGVLFVGGGLFFGGKFFLPTQDSSKILQKANDLYSKGISTHDNDLIRQAMNKYTLWLQQNWNNADKKLVAKTLRFRAGAFVVLGNTNKSINDIEKSIEYDPSGESQLMVCDFKEKQGDLSNLSDCYSKAVTLFKETKTPQKDIGFLLARFFSGDKSAITDYKNFYKESTGRERKIYEMNAQGFFDKATYEEIIK